MEMFLDYFSCSSLIAVSIWCALCLACRRGVALQIISIMPHFHSEVVLHILIWEHTWSFILPHLWGQCTQCFWALLVFLLLLWCETKDKLLLSLWAFWVVRISEAFEHSVNILLTKRCGKWSMHFCHAVVVFLMSGIQLVIILIWPFNTAVVIVPLSLFICLHFSVLVHSIGRSLNEHHVLNWYIPNHFHISCP